MAWLKSYLLEQSDPKLHRILDDIYAIAASGKPEE